MQLETVVSKAPHTPWQIVGDDVLVLTPQRQTVHELNESAAYLWLSLEEPRSIRSLLTTFSEQYDATPDSMLADIYLTVETMVQKGMLTVV